MYEARLCCQLALWVAIELQICRFKLIHAAARTVEREYVEQEPALRYAASLAVEFYVVNVSSESRDRLLYVLRVFSRGKYESCLLPDIVIYLPCETERMDIAGITSRSLDEALPWHTL